MNVLSERRDARVSGGDKMSGLVWDAHEEYWQRRRYREAMARDLRNHYWSHAATLTFSKALHPEGAEREVHSFTRDLGRRSGSPVGWFMVVEDTYEGRAHLHGLLNVRHLTVEDILESWEWRQRKTWPQQHPLAAKGFSNGHESLLSDYRKEAKRRQEALDGKNRMRTGRYRRGRAKVDVYDPEGRWSVYITKNLGGENAVPLSGGPWEKVA